MNDPHVESLRYELKTVKGENYDAPPLRLKRDDYELNLDENLLTITFFKHFAEVEKAKEYIESFLQSWEIYWGITYGHRDISFNYKDAKVIDRNPSENANSKSVNVNIVNHVQALDAVIVSISRNKYPEPPLNFKASQHVITLWDRYNSYKKGNESLYSMSYSCLSYLEYHFGDRDKIKKLFNISGSVIRTIGTLSSERGDKLTARKFTDKLKIATPQEKHWLDKAIRKIILQIGLSQNGNKPEKLTMSDLPSLKKTE